MRIIHFADIHFGMENYGRLDPKTGLHSRLGDWQQSFQAIIDYATGNKKRSAPPVNKTGPVDLVIFAGDAFRTRDPSPTYVRAFGEGIRKIAEAEIPVVLVVGNHDLPNASGKASTLDVFSALAVPNVTVSRNPELIKMKTKHGEIQIVTLPWMYKSQFFAKEEITQVVGGDLQHRFQEKVIEIFQLLLSKIDARVPAIAVVHATVEGASYGSERSILLGNEIIVPLRILTNPKLSYVALGHLHRHQILHQNPPVVYSGSLERIDFSEEEEKKGFVLVETARGKTVAHFVEVPVRKFLTIDVQIADDDDNPTYTVVKKVKEASTKDCVVRVIIRCSEVKSPEIRETPIREALAEANFIAGITKQVAFGQRTTLVAGYSDEIFSTDPLEVLRRFWQSKKVPATRIARLSHAAKALLETVEPG